MTDLTKLSDKRLTAVVNLINTNPNGDPGLPDLKERILKELGRRVANQMKGERA